VSVTPTAAILVAAGILLPLLLWNEKRESLAGKLLSKTPLSLLFVAAALLQPATFPGFFGAMLAGFGCCLVGDVCLAWGARRVFAAGLAAFLLGHLAYCAAFVSLTRPGAVMWALAVPVVAASSLVYRRLLPHLGSLRGAVLAYVVVITLMVIGAGALLGDVRLPARGRWMAYAGALCFYVSDLFVARQRFVVPEFRNRLLGLPLYYLGQFLLAFAIGALA
jgi:uncharacterized membrane protein YhhN